MIADDERAGRGGLVGSKTTCFFEYTGVEPDVRVTPELSKSRSIYPSMVRYSFSLLTEEDFDMIEHRAVVLLRPFMVHIAENV